MSKNASNASVLKQIIDVFPHYESNRRLTYSVKNISQKSSLPEKEIYAAITANPDIFLWMTSKRVTLITYILKIVREEFEIRNYPVLDIEIECLSKIRSDFEIQTLNSRAIVKILSGGTDARVIHYSDFTVFEKKYYDIFNAAAPINKQISPDYDINIYPDVSDNDYISDFNNIFSSDPRSSEMLIKKVKGSTLREIGAADGISRERVRKLIEKPVTAIKDWLLTNEMNLVENYTKEDGTLDEGKFTADFSAEKWMIVKEAIISENKRLRFIKYDESLDIVYKDVYKIKNIIDELSPKSYDSFFDYSKQVLKYASEHGYKFLNEANIESFLAQKPEELPQGIKAAKNTTFRSVLPRILIEYFPNGVKLSDNESMQKILDIASDKYGVSVKGTDPIKNVANKIQSKYYLVDKNTYSAINPPKLSDDFLQKVYKILQDKTTMYVSYGFLFDMYSDELAQYGINNQHALHGALRYSINREDVSVLKDYLCIGRGDSSTALDRFNVISKFLEAAAEPVPVDDILNEFETVSRHDLHTLTIYFPQVVRWDQNNYCNIDGLPIDSAIKKILKRGLDSLTENTYSYANEYTFYEYVKENCPEILDLLNIEKSRQLFEIAAWLYKNEYHFFAPHIVKGYKGTRFSTEKLTNIYIKKMPNSLINRSVLTDEISELSGRSKTAVQPAICSVLSDYIRIDAANYIAPAELGVTSEILEDVSKFIKSHMVNNEFKLTKDLKILSLPKINVPWTPWIIPGIIKHYDLPFEFSEESSVPFTLPLTIKPKK